MEDKLIKRLMTSLKCDSCGQHYEVYNIDILGHREGVVFKGILPVLSYPVSGGSRGQREPSTGSG